MHIADLPSIFVRHKQRHRPMTTHNTDKPRHGTQIAHSLIGCRLRPQTQICPIGPILLQADDPGRLRKYRPAVMAKHRIFELPHQLIPHDRFKKIGTLIVLPYTVYRYFSAMSIEKCKANSHLTIG